MTRLPLADRREPPAASTDAGDQRLVERLRAGEDAAFADLVRLLSPGMLRVAATYVPSASVAEEVVQETWLGVLRGLDRFEGRSSLKTWIYRILVNRAISRGVRETRTVPFAALAAHEGDGTASPLDADRFLVPEEESRARRWASAPRRWEYCPEGAASHRETLAAVRGAIAALPRMQRLVITMRDLEGFPPEEICDVLELTDVNQRVLLHRARSRVRARLEGELV